MPLDWIDVSKLDFNALLLLESVQLSWFPGWLPEAELRVALAANPAVAWYMRHKCPDINAWLDQVTAEPVQTEALAPEAVRQAEVNVMAAMVDLLTYAVDPEVYDRLPFLNWDPDELASLVDFTGKIVIDIGTGTGKLALIAADHGARAVYAVDPVANLRQYVKAKARRLGYRRSRDRQVYTLDGLITDLPFHDGFADVTMGGHVFGDEMEVEYNEMARVTRPGGAIILCPGNNDRDDDRHRFLVEEGFEWARFEEPGDGWKRKYWKTV